jgi:hypothetical protein
MGRFLGKFLVSTEKEQRLFLSENVLQNSEAVKISTDADNAVFLTGLRMVSLTITLQNLVYLERSETYFLRFFNSLP